MKHYPILLAFSLITSLSSYAQEPSKPVSQKKSNPQRVIVNREEFNWIQGPESLPKGAKMAILYGDPSKEGLFTIMLMLPANYKILPHWHSTIENVSAIEGSFYSGIGERFDESGAIQISTGGFLAMPENTPHFTFTKEKAVIQVSGLGPFSIHYISAAGDSRKK